VNAEQESGYKYIQWDAATFHEAILCQKIPSQLVFSELTRSGGRLVRVGEVGGDDLKVGLLRLNIVGGVPHRLRNS